MMTRRCFAVRVAMGGWMALAMTVSAVPTRAGFISEVPGPNGEGTRTFLPLPPPGTATLSPGPLRLLQSSSDGRVPIVVNSIDEFSVPQNAVINSAIFTLHISGAQTVLNPPSLNVSGYGDGDGVVGLGDFVKTTTFLGSTGTLPNSGAPDSLNIPFGFNVTGFVQSLVNNFGFVGFSLDDPSISNVFSWGSLAEDPSRRPVLTIDFTPVPEPASALLMGLGLVGVLLLAARRRRTPGGVHYSQTGSSR